MRRRLGQHRCRQYGKWIAVAASSEPAATDGRPAPHRATAACHPAHAAGAAARRRSLRASTEPGVIVQVQAREQPIHRAGGARMSLPSAGRRAPWLGMAGQTRGAPSRHAQPRRLCLRRRCGQGVEHSGDA
eukprot:352205-Chlamydomonas_euryale.AAC.11